MAHFELTTGQTRLMGVLNVTPDSFSDGGRFRDLDAAIEHGLQMVDAGAAMIDVGGESTRPGYRPVPVTEQIERVVPVVERLRARVDVPISIDTTRAEVAKAALAAGADLINDTSALGDDSDLAGEIVAAGCPVVLMHRFDPPRAADDSRDPVAAIVAGLRERLARAVACGIAEDRVILDPGIGFGTRADDVPQLLARIDAVQSLGRPLLVGPSRKSFLAPLTGRGVDQREAGTAAVVAALTLAGVDWIRVHDVPRMHDVVRVAAAIRTAKES